MIIKHRCEICDMPCKRTFSRVICSDKCRIFAYIKKKEDGCWVWTGKKGQDMYGQISVNGKRKRAHRVSFELFKEKILPGMLILHSCHNTLCVNPDHLRQGTVKENSNDMIAASRSLIGEKSRRAKLKEQDVKKIKELDKQGFCRLSIAKQYGITRECISSIILGKSWKHIN